MYLDYFGLREPPFNITPNPRYLYFTATHRQALEHLTYGIEQRRGFILLTGDVGTGKTTLCRALLERLESTHRTALLLDPCLSETQMLRAILHELGLSDVKGDRLALRETLNQFLLGEMSAGRDVALIIDEAQHLSLAQLERIRLLSNLETDDRKLLQIVLSGQPELAVRLADPRLRQLRQRITVRCRLEPIGRDEVDGYLTHRLSVAGADRRLLFEPDAVCDIFDRTAGVPRLVNAVSDVSLLAAFADRTPRVNRSHVASAAEELRESLA